MAGVLQLIDSEGAFNGPGLDAFIKAVDLSSCGLSYAVVSIMGPQSSGKSTLLNHLFSTRFTEMNALSGRSQTTQGVWLARASGIDPCTLIMDLEGTDGTERGEDDTAFEKQSSLFALAVSDIVLINMWCHDIGREHAANKPLLKTVFQVMMRLFTPRKTTLLFVIRDKTRTPLEVLDNSLRREVQKIWDSVPKPEMHRETPLTEFFNIEVTALSNYEDKEEQFKAEVSQLRQRFFNSIAPGGLAGDRQGVVPGTGFSVSTQAIWRVVKENKDLDLPTHKVMVATVRCDAIAAEKIAKLGADKEWLDLYEHSMQGPVSGFGDKAAKLLDDQITGYDQEAAHFEESVRGAKRHELLSHILDMFQPAQKALVGHHRGKAFSRFKQDLAAAVAHPDGTQHFAASVRRCAADAMADFERGSADALIRRTGWQKVEGSFKLSKIREQLRADLEAHAASVRSEKLAELISGAQKHLDQALVIPTASLLQAGSPEAWSSIRKLLAQQTDKAERDLSAALTGFEMDKEEEFRILADLKDFATNTVKRKAKEEAGNALAQMNYRFNHIFSQDADSIPRVWSAEDDVKAITREARFAALKLLSVLAALRLEEGVDEVEAALSTLMGDSSEASLSGSRAPPLSGSRAPPELEVSNVLAASTWEGISAENTLISPIQCKALWRQFKSDTQYAISQAVLAQEASKQRNRTSLPPMWAILAMIVLGFNEFMTLLRNPLYLGIIFISYLFGKAVWVQLDIAREFEAGLVPGIISVTSKLLPTLMKILKKLAEEGQQIAGEAETNRAQPGGHSAGLTPAHSSNATVNTASNGIETPSSTLRHRQQASALTT